MKVYKTKENKMIKIYNNVFALSRFPFTLAHVSLKLKPC